MTPALHSGCSIPALANSSVRIRPLILRSPSGLTRSTLFLRLQIMVGRFRHLRVAALRSGRSNLLRSITSGLDPAGGCSKQSNAEALMSKLPTFVLDNFNDIDRYSTQARSLLVCIGSDENLEELHHHVLANALWAIRDPLESISETNNNQYKLIREAI